MSAVSDAVLIAISPASILITKDSLSSKTGGRFLAVRRSAPRTLWILRTTRSVMWRFTFFISTRTGLRSETAGRGGGDGSGAASQGADGASGDAEATAAVGGAGSGAEAPAGATG